MISLDFMILLAGTVDVAPPEKPTDTLMVCKTRLLVMVEKPDSCAVGRTGDMTKEIKDKILELQLMTEELKEQMKFLQDSNDRIETLIGLMSEWEVLENLLPYYCSSAYGKDKNDFIRSIFENLTREEMKRRLIETEFPHRRDCAGKITRLSQEARSLWAELISWGVKPVDLKKELKEEDV